MTCWHVLLLFHLPESMCYRCNDAAETKLPGIFHKFLFPLLIFVELV